MSKVEVQLCTKVILDSFGPHVAAVCSHLLVSGRSSLAMLSRALASPEKRSSNIQQNMPQTHSSVILPLEVKERPSLSTLRIKQALYVLLQHYLVTYADEVEGSRIVTYYEADSAAIVDRIALPIYAQVIHDELGPAEFDIYLRILYHGRTSPEYLIKNELPPEDHQLTLKCFGTLLKGNWISSVTSGDGLTSEDKNLKALQEEIERKSQGRPVSAKELASIKSTIAAKRTQDTLDSERRNSQILGGLDGEGPDELNDVDTLLNGGSKRRKVLVENIDFDSVDNIEKMIDRAESKTRSKSKIIDEDDEDVHGDEDNKDTEKNKMDEEKIALQEVDLSAYSNLIESMDRNRHIFFRYNPTRMRDRIRNEFIEELTLERFNKGASNVVKRLLRLGEQASSAQSRRGLSTTESKGLKTSITPLSSRSSNNILILNPSKDLLADRSCFVEPINELSLGASLPADEKKKLLIAETSTTLKDVHDPLKEYLEYISGDHKFGLLVQCREISIRHWSINLTRAKQQIRQKFIESIIEEKFGESCKRVFRILLDREKLTEAQIAKIALMDPKTVRYCLYLMHSSGLAFIQDVPKTLDHSAARTFFLWYVSIDKAIRTSKLNCQRLLYTIRTKRSKETESKKDLIEKSLRVEMYEQELAARVEQGEESKKPTTTASSSLRLTEHEKKTLETLNSTVKTLTASELRVMKLLIAID